MNSHKEPRSIVRPMTECETDENRRWMQDHYNAMQDAAREGREEERRYHRDCWLECRNRDEQRGAR
jgi:hypothetical protein